MVKLLIVGLYVILLTASLFAEKEESGLEKNSLCVNSGEAQYDGKEITLVGKVVVQHSLGQISSHRLSFLPAPKKDKSKSSFLKAREDVQIELKGGGCLFCQFAEVDYEKMQGIFLGNAEYPDVTYINKGEDTSKNHTVPFEVKSTQMTMDLLRESSSENSKAKTLVKQIQAIQNVRVRYQQDYLLLADKACYQRLEREDSSPCAGFITLSTNNNSDCHLTNQNGDHLRAKTITVDTAGRCIFLSQPRGSLLIQRENLPPQTLEFTGNEMTLNDKNQMLTLQGQVDLTYNKSIHLQTDHEISIIQAVVNGKKTVKSIQAPEKICISYVDKQQGNTHTIQCPGFFNINHENLEMVLNGFSPAGEEEKNNQVYVDDILGEMYADRVQINYDWEDKKLMANKIILEGNVRLFNRFDGHPEESGLILHYALADKMEYLPKQQEMTLLSTRDNRVLFFDKVNNIQMSAPSLKVHHNTTTHKNSIQGVGDVRFTFIEKEFEQLKKRFRMENSSNSKTGDNNK